MSAFEAEVRRALVPEQQDLVTHPEHCSADPLALFGVGRAEGQQVRVRLAGDPAAFALYTVSHARPEESISIVRMGLGGRQRLGTPEPCAILVDSAVTASGLSDAEAQSQGEFVEHLADTGTHTGLIALAPHGGTIEPQTDAQARRVASQLARFEVSAWWCLGFGNAAGGASARLHITSSDIHEASFPALGAVIGRGFRYAVSFHGFGRDGVLVGGAAPVELRRQIARSIETAVAGTGIEVSVAQPGDDFSGASARNIVNRITASGLGGVQIEQSLTARTSHGRQIADAVAAVFAGLLLTPDI